MIPAPKPKKLPPREEHLPGGVSLGFPFDKWHFEVNGDYVTVSHWPVDVTIPRKAFDAFVHWFVGEPY